MVRRKVEIKPIEDKAKRHTTFTKRRQGLFKKTKDLCDKCGAEAAVVTFSKAGNGFAFGHPAVHIVLDRYLADPSSSVSEKDPNFAAQERVHGGGGVQKEPPPLVLSETEKILEEAMVNGRPDWDGVVGNLGFSELEELEAVIKELQSEVAARVVEVAAGEGTVQESELDGCDHGDQQDSVKS